MIGIEPLYEDNHLIVINKPSGLLVQGDQTGDIPLNELVKEYLRVKYNKPGDAYLGTVHRLDRPASGVLIFAKTSKALTRMNKMFAERRVDKSYWVITEAIAPESAGELIHYLRKDRKKNRAIISKPNDKQAKRAVLKYKLLGSSKEKYLYQILLSTGRPHQIRVQMSSLACPIIGDLKYGAKHSLSDASIALHCRAIGFYHPVSKEYVKIVGPLPSHHIWDPFRNIQD